VLYSNREPPLEIRSISGLNRGESVGYVTFGECTAEGSALDEQMV
jgi:hypothetical protein